MIVKSNFAKFWTNDVGEVGRQGETIQLVEFNFRILFFKLSKVHALKENYSSLG